MRPGLPRGLAGVDVRLFDDIARHRMAGLAWLRPLSTAANHSKLWLACAGVLALTRGRRGRRAAGRGLLTIAATSILANLIVKPLLPRRRPLVAALPRGRLLARMPTSSAMPSGHAASAAGFAAAVAIELPLEATPVALLAAAVGASRIYVGAHYPGDVLAGAALGLGAALAGRAIWPPERRLPGESSMVAAPACPNGRGVVIAVNPQAGSARDILADLRRDLPEAGIIEAGPAEFESRLDEAATTAGVLGIAGGDGSVGTAASIAARTGKPLLAVPGGTLNHLCRDLRLDSVAACADAVSRGRALRLDEAMAGNRRILNTAAAGIYPNLVQLRERWEPRVGKWPALAVAAALLVHRLEPMRVRVDGDPLLVWSIFVGNCEYGPTGMVGLRRTNLSDGRLDIRLLISGPRKRPLRMSIAYATNHWTARLGYRRWTATHLSLAFEQPTLVAVDGEVGDPVKTLDITKDGSSLIVYCGPDAVG